MAVDIGGTFTDLVLTERGRVVATDKILTTTDDPARGVVAGVEGLLADLDAGSVADVVHGTTLVSNSLIERKGAVTGLITTEGFRDVLESGREQRYDLYDLFLEMPAPLVPRQRRWGVKERVLASGLVDQPLERDSLADVVAAAQQAEVDAIAVCLLHSYRNPEHELAIRELLEKRLPGVAVTISSEVSPEIGEYQRVSTTVANAFVLPVVSQYLGSLEHSLEEIGIRGPLRIMLSTGGLVATETAQRFPVRLLESGPAAGVLGAAFLGAANADRPVMAFDMGGTTAKAALVESGNPLIANEFEAARVYRFTKGSGLPIRLPVIDMIEIGAGGGSIARVGPFGLPKVGPDSAGSDPGPVCYGLGGSHPTVTDADLVLGYLDARYFLGGEMDLDIEAARIALGELGEQMGFSPEETAGAVHRVVNENMASAARMHAIERGRDIREYTLVATGGAGPVHAWGVAKALGIPRIVFPPRAGVASAFGMLTAPISFEFARSLPAILSEVEWAEVREALDGMLADGRRLLDESGVGEAEVEISADIRFQGQGEALRIELGRRLAENPAAPVAESFTKRYRTLYGSMPTNVEPEVLTWRLRISGPRPHPDIAARLGGGPGVKRHRMAWFAESGYGEATVYDRYQMSASDEVRGPAVVEERESTIVIGPGGVGVVGENGNLEVEVD
ncbi:MAG TPA: hydantoinase/oxoprolinase family protein [Acidimicrobiia bacterium]|nr:hydantoinase/oxoprolinase family protein [Acidimicrobiia bacterium]